MTKRKRVNAIFNFDDNVSQLLTDASTFYTAITTAPASTYITITPAELLAAKGRLAAALEAEVAVGKGTIGLAAARDLAVSLVVADIRNFVILVQTAANNEVDEATATAIVTECGLVTWKERSNVKGDFAVNNDPITVGMLNIIFKSTPKGVNACYETQLSTDGISWTSIKTSTDSYYNYSHGREAGTILYFRGRVILSEKKGGAGKWITPSASFIITL